MAVGNSTVNTGMGRRSHTYHAETAALHGNLERPLDQKVPPQTYLKLKEHGGYISQHSDIYRLEGLVSFSAAYGQVAGSEEVKKAGHGWVTLATSVIENLNILEVVTADRVVAQISTEHPQEGYIPRITFLGSRFENLRVAGQLIDVPIDPYVLWDEEIALEHKERDGMRLKRNLGIHRHDVADLHPPEDLPPSFPDFTPHPAADPKRHECIHASLVGESKQDRGGWLPHIFKEQPARHIIDVPHFGRIYLGLICLEHYEFVGEIPHQTRVALSMIKVKLGCAATGSGSFAMARTNGSSRP